MLIIWMGLRMDNKLPILDDYIKKFSSFKKYEFTERVAFEMAIRNKDVINLRKNLEKIRNKVIENYSYSKKYTIIKNTNKNDYMKITYLDPLNFAKEKFVFLKHQKEIIEDMEKNVKLNEALGNYNINDINKVKNSLKEFENRYLELVNPNKNRLNYSMEYLSQYKNRFPNLYKDIENFIDNYELLMDKYYILFDLFIDPTINDKHIVSNSKSILRKMKLKNRKDNKDLLTTTDGKVINSDIFGRSSELKLFLPKNKNKILSLNINFALPIDEIKEYITLLKKTFDQDTNSIKSMLQSTNKEILDSKMSLHHAIAKCFFVYDYIEVRKSNIDKLNKETNKQLTDIIKDIKASSLLPSYKKKQIKEAEKDHKENIISYPSLDNNKKNSYYNEDEFKTSGIKPGTAKKHYFDNIRGFIEELKYKELVTGIEIGS